MDTNAQATEFERVFDLHTELMCILDHTGQIVRANRRWLNALGYQQHHIQDKNILDILHPDDVAVALNILQGLSERSPNFMIIARILSSNQHYLLFQWQGSFDPQTNMIYASGRDITGTPFEMLANNDAYTQLNKKLLQSDAQLRAILTHAVDSIVMMDQHATILMANPATETIFGYDNDELIGQNLKLLMANQNHVHSEDNIQRDLTNNINNITGRVIETFGQHKDSSLISLDLSISEMSIEDKTLYLVIMRNIWKRKKFENKLYDALILKRAILDSANSSIISTTVDGTVKTFNAGAENMLQYTRDEIIGKVTPEIFHDKHEVAERASALSEELGYHISPGFETFVAKARRGQPDENEWTYIRKDGSTLTISLSVTPLYDTHHNISGFLGIGRDITETKKVERMKNEFVSTVSHELRTPLTSIHGAISLMLGGVAGDMTDAAHRMLQIANTNCERLIRLISDILDIEKMQSGHMDFHLKVENTCELLKRAITEMTPYANKSNVNIQVNCHSRNVMVFVDADRITQVITNLLSNAIKFSPQNSEILVELHEQDHDVKISVQDQGMGIPHAFRDRLFRKFSQADSSDTRQKGGTGLGLYIAKMIVNKHHGQIDFQSTPGQGTAFFFTLPKPICTLRKRYSQEQQP